MCDESCFREIFIVTVHRELAAKAATHFFCGCLPGICYWSLESISDIPFISSRR